jgi:hypothetical protein
MTRRQARSASVGERAGRAAMQAGTSHPDDELLLAIIKQLTALSKENRRRIIQTLATFFEVTI